MLSKRINRFLFILALLVVMLPMRAACAQADDAEHKARHLSVLNYVTGWMLDSAGYHPAVYMLLENTSGKDLSGVTIKMQGKFTDNHTLETCTARTEIRRALKPHQQFPLALVAPREYELPRDTNFWPVMECKAMLRVGTVGDEGTEYLLGSDRSTVRVDSATTTQDDAFQKLNELTSYNKAHPTTHHTTPDPLHAKPLLAKADRIKSTPQAVAVPRSTDIFGQKPMPGLGEDFFQWEKVYGLPGHIDAKKKDFTWARYKSASGTELVVASKERTGKVDLIAFVLSHAAKNEQALIDQCKLFAGSQRNVKLSPASKSVKYLPSGRIEMVSAVGPGLRILSMSLPSSSGQTGNLIMITRLGQEPDELLRNHQAGNEVLKGLPLGEIGSEK